MTIPPSSRTPLPFSPSAWEVLRYRYLRKDRAGTVGEAPAQMVACVACIVAAAEANDHGSVAQCEETFFHRLSSLHFRPHPLTLMNARTMQGQLAACCVRPMEDSLESIFQATKERILIHQSDGRTRFSDGRTRFSFLHLRPRGDVVAAPKEVASGPVSFLRVIGDATDVIKQGGRRRGANRAVLRVDHPDIFECICAKEDPIRCKGVTVFRSDCKGNQMLSLGIPPHVAEFGCADGLQAGLEFTGECRNCTV